MSKVVLVEVTTPYCTLYNDISQNGIIKYGTAIGASCIGGGCIKSYHSSNHFSPIGVLYHTLSVSR
jgi:hypothetical protein